MLPKALVFVCATVGLVVGSCIEVRPQQETSRVVSIQAEPSFISAPIENSYCSGSSNVFSSGQVVSAPVYSSGSSVSVPVVTESSSPVVVPSGSSFSFPSVSSGNSVAELTFEPSSGSSSGSLSEVIAALSGATGSSSRFSTGSSAAVATNGPETSPLPVVQAPPVTLRAVEFPMITLSSPAIPAPRVLSQRCICTKTIVRPQVYQRTVTVPKIQRYLKRTVTPVAENLSYKSTPVTQESSGSFSAALSGYGFSSTPVFSSGSGASSSPVLLSSRSGYSGSGLVLSGSSSPVYISSGSSSASPVVVSESSCPRFY